MRVLMRERRVVGYAITESLKWFRYRQTESLYPIAGPSARMYYETTRSGHFGAGTERVEVPVGAAMFPGEIFRPSRRWAERSYNIVHWSEPPRGGHFAACEVPDLFVEEVRSFFRRVR